MREQGNSKEYAHVKECAKAIHSWNKELVYQRGRALGGEFKAKGVNIALGPVIGPLGRIAEGGRNWEGKQPQPRSISYGSLTTTQVSPMIHILPDPWPRRQSAGFKEEV